MNTRILLVCFLASGLWPLASVFSDDPPATGKDVPAAAKEECERRGDMVTSHGAGARDGVDDLISAAYGIPADDSGRFFITVITGLKDPACERLKSDFRTAPELKAWAKPDDSETSWSHYHEFNVNDPTQRWRWANLKITTLPTILMQPPRNRQFGDPKTVILQHSGYDGDAKALSAKMSTVLRAYLTKLYEAQQVGVAGGHAQTTSTGPPWSPTEPTPFPTFPGPPFQIPPANQPATLEQLRAACPGASAEFLLAQLTARATIEQAQAAYRLVNPPIAPPTTPSQPPATPTPSLLTTAVPWLLAAFGLSGFGGLIGLALTWIRRVRIASGQKPILSEQQFNDLRDALTKPTNVARSSKGSANSRES